MVCTSVLWSHIVLCKSFLFPMVLCPLSNESCLTLRAEASPGELVGLELIAAPKVYAVSGTPLTVALFYWGRYRGRLQRWMLIARSVERFNIIM